MSPSTWKSHICNGCGTLTLNTNKPLTDYQYEVTSLPVDETLFYRRNDMVQRLRVLIRYAQLAPSTYNSQPWLFSIQSPNQIWVYADPNRWLKIADADKREMHLSLGCALENLMIAASHYNYKYEIDYLPDRLQLNLMAVLHLTPVNNNKPHSPDAALMQAILNRRTSRSPLLPEPLQASHWALLESCFVNDVKVVTSRQSSRLREKLQELTPMAYQVLYSDRAYRLEHAQRLVMGNTLWQSWRVRLQCMLRQLMRSGGKRYAKRDQRWISKAPALILIGADEDTALSRLKCGRVLQRLALLAHTMGIGVQPMSQILEIPELRDELKRTTGSKVTFEPMIVCRLGYHGKKFIGGKPKRRKLADVLV